MKIPRFLRLLWRKNVRIPPGMPGVFGFELTTPGRPPIKFGKEMDPMRYLTFAGGQPEQPYLAPLAEDDASWLTQACWEMNEASVNEFRDTWSALCSSAAPSSFVLGAESVLWLFEWPPGLVILEFRVRGGIEWTAIRSQVPGFGGRDVTPGEWDEYDEDAPNPQYNLIFTPFDAQFDEADRNSAGFKPAQDGDLDTYDLVMEWLQPLLAEAQSNAAKDGWRSESFSRIEALCGMGRVIGG